MDLSNESLIAPNIVSDAQRDQGTGGVLGNRVQADTGTTDQQEPSIDFREKGKNLMDKYPDAYTEMVDAEGQSVIVGFTTTEENQAFVNTNGDKLYRKVCFFQKGIAYVSAFSKFLDPQSTEIMPSSPEILSNWKETIETSQLHNQNLDSAFMSGTPGKTAGIGLTVWKDSMLKTPGDVENFQVAMTKYNRLAVEQSAKAKQEQSNSANLQAASNFMDNL